MFAEQDGEVNAGSDGIQCQRPHHLSVSIASPAQSHRLSAGTTAALVRVSIYRIHCMFMTIRLIQSISLRDF